MSSTTYTPEEALREALLRLETQEMKRLEMQGLIEMQTRLLAQAQAQAQPVATPPAGPRPSMRARMNDVLPEELAVIKAVKAVKADKAHEAVEAMSKAGATVDTACGALEAHLRDQSARLKAWSGSDKFLYNCAADSYSDSFNDFISVRKGDQGIRNVSDADRTSVKKVMNADTSVETVCTCVAKMWPVNKFRGLGLGGYVKSDFKPKDQMVPYARWLLFVLGANFNRVVTDLVEHESKSGKKGWLITCADVICLDQVEGPVRAAYECDKTRGTAAALITYYIRDVMWLAIEP